MTLVILGSATPPGRLHRAVNEAAGRAAARHGEPVPVRDLATLRIHPAGAAPPDGGDDTAALLEEIADADAVVLATPVYRASFTGVLKNLLDHVPVEALRGTPVGIVAMGAGDHHHLGVDRHLRDVLTFFGAVVAPTAAWLTSADFADGVPGRRAEEQLDQLLDTVHELARRLDGVPPLGPAPLAARPR